MTDPEPMPACLECGEPCRHHTAMLCSDRCRTRRHRAGRSTPKAQHIAAIKAASKARQLARRAEHAARPTRTPARPTVRATLAEILLRLERIELGLHLDPTPLRELVNRWRFQASGATGLPLMAGAVAACADELEELLIPTSSLETHRKGYRP